MRRKLKWLFVIGIVGVAAYGGSLQATPSSITSSTLSVGCGQARYDPYLDALRVRPCSPDPRRGLAIGTRRTAKTTPLRPCGRCQ